MLQHIDHLQLVGKGNANAEGFPTVFVVFHPARLLLLLVHAVSKGLLLTVTQTCTSYFF